MEKNNITPFGYFLLATFFILLSYAGWLYTKSIDWNVLDRLQDAPLSIPTGPVTGIIATPSATTNPKK